MKKKSTPLFVMALCALMLSVTGCGKTPTTDVPIESQTATPSESTASTTVTEPTTESVIPIEIEIETETATDTDVTLKTHSTILTSTSIATDMTMDTALSKLQEMGIVASDTNEVTAIPSISDDYVSIESVSSFADSFIVVTCNTQLEHADPSDISLKKYSDDWYSLSASNTTMTITDSLVTVNDEGKTVIIYQVSDKLDGTKAVTDTSEQTFSDLDAAITLADNYLSWQMEHGGWDKGVEEQATAPATATDSKNKFSGWSAQDGGELGTIDNDATYTQMRHIAAVYRETGDEIYKESVLKGLDFIFHLQYESGGFAQVYPKRGNYSDNVTFNDNAMINVLIMLEDMRDRRYPFDSDLLSDDDIAHIDASIQKAIDYILTAQIETNGKLTAWCAQHDPVTYEPVGARAYELPSISGSESVSIIKFLMNQEQTPEIENAVTCAIQWFKDSEIKGIKYDKKDANGVYFIEDANSSIWYRFYDIETNMPIFCDRDGIKKHNIAEISEERRTGYSWAGTYPKKLLEIYDTHGYYAGRIEAVVVNTKSATAEGKTLCQGNITSLDTEIVSN